MRGNLLKVVLVVGVGLVAYAAMRIADGFIDSSWTPGVVSGVIMAFWILAVRWCYRGDPPPVNPRHQRNLLL